MTVLRTRPRRHDSGPYLADGVVAVAFAGAAVLLSWHGTGLGSTEALVWDVTLAAPLALRRRSPMAVATVIAALCLVQWSTGVRAPGDLAFLVALYNLGAHPRRRWHLPVAVATAEVGVVLAVLRWANHSDLLTGALLTGTVTAAWVLGVYVHTRRAYLATVLDRAETAERDRDSRAQVAVAGERARIAREMHDIIAHSLSIMITLNDAAGAVTRDPQVRDTVNQAAEVGRQALGEMQLLLGVLHADGPPDLVPQPGTHQLADLVAMVRAAGLPVELAVSGDLSTLATTAQLTTYRIVQESLTNIVKHARNVTRVTVEIARRATGLTITVVNDGDIVTLHPTATSGHGLAGMQERAEIYHGRVHADPNQHGGWTTSATLTLTETIPRR